MREITYSIRNLESRWFSFTGNEIEILCTWSNFNVVKLNKFIEEKKADIIGLFYEISQVSGNWTFKDRVLPGLFEELFEILMKVKKKIEDIYAEDISISYLDSMSYNDFNKNRRRYNLLTYLINQFKSSFITHGDKQLSCNYTHRLLEKKVRKMDIRITKLLREYQDVFNEECKRYAREGLRNLIINKLQTFKLPYLGTLQALINRFPQNEDISEHLTSSFKPDCGNHEYHIGLEPIWCDSPGRGYYAFYFDYFDTESNNNNLVLITENRISDYTSDGFPGIIEGRPRIIDIFEQLGKKERFLEWFNNEIVKERMIWHFTFHIYFESTERNANKEINYEKTTEWLRDKLHCIEQYYGITYDFHEVKEFAKKKWTDQVESYNLINEEKQRRKEIIENLFPEIKEEINQERLL